MPKVTIGVPVYNEESFIGATIGALKSQEADDVSFHISDNGSTDRTFELAKRAIGGDSRFLLHRHDTNRGAAFNFGYLLRNAQSRYFMWLGGHDMLSENAVSSLSSLLDHNPFISMAMATPHLMDENGNDLGMNDSAVYSFEGSPVERFISAIRRLNDCTMVHSMFRLETMRDFAILPVFAIDHIFIAKLLWHGTAAFDPSSSYFRRDFSTSRPTTYMERIVGNVETAQPDLGKYAAICMTTLSALNNADPRSQEQILEVSKILVERFGTECAVANKIPSTISERLHVWLSARFNVEHK